MTRPDDASAIDEILDRAFRAINRGDSTTAKSLAEQVLALDGLNSEAEDLLAAPDDHGELRRLTILFADVVDSTVLSTRVEPEVYRTVVGTYREAVLRVVDEYDGHIASTKGDGLLAVFGHPHAHENDATRAVRAGLDIARDVARLDDVVRRQFGVGIQVRVGVHRGLVYLDTKQDDVYGLAANLAARLSGLADNNTVVVSESIARLIAGTFELENRPDKPVKGVEGPIRHYRAVAERSSEPDFRGPLVGRHAERDYLRKAWDLAADNSLDVPGVALVGEAGIGKSRLASTATELATRDGAAVLELVGSPFHTSVGLYPVRRLLEQRCGITLSSYPAERLRLLTDELESQSFDPGAMVPLLAPVLGIPPETGYQSVAAEGPKLFDQIIDAVGRYLLGCLGGSTGLILVEDTHWFDDDTMEVVVALLDSAQPNLLIVMTGREASVMPSSVNTERVELKPLTDLESDELISALNPEVTPRARTAVQRRCDGMPLFIEELLAQLQEQPDTPTKDPQVPDSLYEALLARLRTSKSTKRVIEVAAMVSSHIDRGLLQTALKMSEAQLDEILADLTAGRVLERTGDGIWRFRHELLREVATELSPPSKRAKLHGLIAETLVGAAGGGTPDWPKVAGHYVMANRHAEAASAFEKAAQDASRRGALQEAHAHLSSALEQLEQLPAGAQRDSLEVGVRLRRGQLSFAASGAADADDFERCLQLCDPDLGTDDFFATLVALYGYYALHADLRRVQSLLQSLRLGLEQGRRYFHAFNLAGFGMLAWWRGDFDGALSKLAAAEAEQTLEDAAALDAIWFMPNEGIASVYTHLALAKFMKGDLVGADADMAAAERRCADLNFPKGPYSRCYAQSLDALIRVTARQYDRAAEVMAQLAEGAEEHEFEMWGMVAAAIDSSLTGLTAVAGGDADDPDLAAATDSVGAYIDGCRALEVNAFLTYYYAIQGELLIAGERGDEARKTLDEGLALAADTEMTCWDAELLRVRAHSHSDVDARRADLEAAIRLAKTQGATIFELSAAVDLFRVFGDDAARTALVHAVDGFSEGSTWPQLVTAKALLG